MFTDPLTFDFESVTGRPASTLPLDRLVPGLRNGLAGFTATHHAITNHRITLDGDHAVIRAHIKAEHWLPPELAVEGRRHRPGG